MSGWIAGISLAVAAAGAAASGIQSAAAADQQKKAAAKSAKLAADQNQLATDQINKANAKSPDTAAIASANEQAAKGGVSSTMLTGVGGVDSSTLSLGKSTLLGS